MADNSSMTNVSQVEQYGKNLAQVNQQMLQIFKQMRQQTKAVGTYWKDDQYKRFQQDFDQDIMKNIQEISAKMDMFSKYVAKMVEIHRMAQQQRYY
jgi:hypothetical protein